MPRSLETFLDPEIIENGRTTTHQFGKQEDGTALLAVTIPSEASRPTVKGSLHDKADLWVSAPSKASLIIRGHREIPTEVFVATQVAGIDAYRSHVDTADYVGTVKAFFDAHVAVGGNVTSTAEAGDGTSIKADGKVNTVLIADGSEGIVEAANGIENTESISGR